MSLADFREALSGLVEELLISQPLMKVLVSHHAALHQQKVVLQQQHQQHQLEQVLVRLQETEALVETALRAPLFEAVTNCLQVGALSVVKAMINRSSEQQEWLERGQGQQEQQGQLKLSYRELQRPFLLLLSQVSTGNRWCFCFCCCFKCKIWVPSVHLHLLLLAWHEKLHKQQQQQH